MKKFPLPAYLYHTTAIRFLPSILQQGLIPSFSKSGIKGVYLSDLPDVAENYAFMHNEPSILLQIDTTFLKEKSLHPDDYELRDFLDDKARVPPATGGWKYKKEIYFSIDDVPWQNSLKWVNQVAYLEKIPPQAIKIIRKV